MDTVFFTPCFMFNAFFLTAWQEINAQALFSTDPAPYSRQTCGHGSNSPQIQTFLLLFFVCAIYDSQK